MAERKASQDATISNWRPVGIPGLEPAALQAVQCLKNASVSAGPGAGKTELLAQKATYLLDTRRVADPQRILAISFKRDSAANLGRRVRLRAGISAHRFESMTFDAFAKSILDRFHHLLPEGWALPPGGYELVYGNKNVHKEFLSRIARPLVPETRKRILMMPVGKFMPQVVGSVALAPNPLEKPDSPLTYVASQWWKERYLNRDIPEVDFTMINRLAELILRCNPSLMRALRSTYRHVFVDEFQDTTAAQFSFLMTAFLESDVVVTVVGDGKQRIMEFAGALPDAGTDFGHIFEAEHFDLRWNFRSSPALVRAQHGVALALDARSVDVTSQAVDEEGQVPLSTWSFSSATTQANELAKWISSDMVASGRPASAFAILVRQNVSDYQSALQPVFDATNLSLRNDDLLYGDIRLQDLLVSDFTRFILGLMTLSLKRMGQGSVWHETRRLFGRIFGEGYSDREERRISDLLSFEAAALGAWFSHVTVREVTAAMVVDRALRCVPDDTLRRFVRGQDVTAELQAVRSAFEARLAHVMVGKNFAWINVVSDFAGEDAVPMMTIHKSKGLEYHTVFVLGFDEAQWWNYEREKLNETATFFVGLSRAAQRVIFTSLDAAGREGALAELFALLDEAGAARREFS